MFLVTVLESNRVIRKETFRNEDCAWAFWGVWYDRGYRCDFSRLGAKR